MISSSLITLYSDPLAVNSHRVRLLAAEKEDLGEIIDVHPHDLPEALLEINPSGSLPTLSDREVVLYDPQVIMEYIDERFPNPILLPVDPVERARIRMTLATIRDHWLPLVVVLDDVTATEEQKAPARKKLENSLLQFKRIFQEHEYFMGDTYTLADITLAPLLWRLKKYNIPSEHFGVKYDLYIKRVFERKAFANSLSLYEENMR